MSDNPYKPYQQPPQQPNQDPNYQGDYQSYQSPYQQPYQSPYQQPNPQQDYQQPSYNYQQHPKSVYPQPYQSAYQQPNKTQFLSMNFGLAGLLCYMPFFAINFIASIALLVTEPKSNFFVRFHAIQSLLLSAVTFVFSLIVGFAWFFIIGMGAAIGRETGGVLIGLSFLGMLLFCAVFGITIFILHIVGMVKAYNNQMWEIPFIGKYARRFSQSA